MSLNILVVDDSHIMRRFIIRAIKACGIKYGEIIEAANGKEALEKLEQSWVDIILTDINMPEMDGIEFIKNLKAHEIYKKLPIVVITTEGTKEKIQQLQELGIDGYIKKPFPPEEIKRTLSSLIGKEFFPEEGWIEEGEDF